MKVFVIDSNKQPLDPCSAGKARQLLAKGKAAVYRRYPFTIILHREVEESEPQPLRFKIDPGAKTSGLALVNDQSGEVVWAAELQHRGWQIKDALEKRSGLRRGRRSRKTRYRPPRFDNRSKPKGWLPPSLMSRIYNIETWYQRLAQRCLITSVSIETNRFDMQKMEKPEISGVEYQQGELHGYEVREYLLEKFNHTCAYCNKTDVPMEIEHINPRSRGGSNRISNLTLSCRPCNEKKGNQTASEFGHPEVEAQAKKPLRSAAAVNMTRREIQRRFFGLGLSVEVSTGGRTKYNRSVRNLPKTHWLDAVCVGQSTPDELKLNSVRPLLIKAMGRGRRQVCDTDEHGFRRKKKNGEFNAPRLIKRTRGFQTGDIVRAEWPKGKYAGNYVTRITNVRKTGKFGIKPAGYSKPFNVDYKYCQIVHHSDGYDYNLGEAFAFA
jgi:5-methylcytosine-specific restriction endonuclease McrA